MRLRRWLRKLLKTAPGKVAAALLTALVGAGVAYFAPGILDSLTGRDELQIAVQTDVQKIDTFEDLGQFVIVPFGVPATGSPGPGCAGFQAWAERVGGVQGSRTDFRLVVQGGTEETFIGGIRARILERREPLSGTGFQCPSAGQAEIRSVVIDLDERATEPSGILVDGGSEKNIAFTVAPGETEVFDLTVHTESRYCKWVLALETTQGGDSGTILIDDHGRPFETTAWGGAPEPWGSYPPESPAYYSWDYQANWGLIWEHEVLRELPAGQTAPQELPTVGLPPGYPGT